ncbi:MAG: hypothetical protein ACKV2Q_18630 [Planctomycetaceae bacterium]
MTQSTVTTAATLGGWIVGGAVGVLGAPAWEMAGLFIGFFASIAGASAAACLASARKRRIFAVVAVVVLAGLFALLSQSNPLLVTIRGTLLVVAAGAVGGLIGYLLGKLSPSQDRGSQTSRG